MRAAIYEAFGALPRVESVPDPSPPNGGAIVRVRATGLCRSDWHGWMGHDPTICLPHVPGHEFAGEVVALGSGVRRWAIGDRVTAPFVNGCGRCAECLSGNAQVCPDQRQPGFTHWGSFAEYVVIEAADFNLVGLPEELDFAAAASLGCRFATAYRGVVSLGGVASGQWVAVHGCGGVGLSAVQIAVAAGARVVAVDRSGAALTLARDLGAEVVLRLPDTKDVAQAIRDITHGGAHLSVEAVGHPEVCRTSVECLRRRGTHVQLGLLLGDQRHPSLPMDRLVAHELRIVGGHGMAARDYPELLNLMLRGRLDPQRIIQRWVNLDQGAVALAQMDQPGAAGITLIDTFASADP